MTSTKGELNNDVSFSESQLASLVGLEQEEEQYSLPSADTEEEDVELLKTDPKNNLSQRPAWGNPLLKAGTVMFGCFFIAIAGYMFLGSLMKPFPKSRANTEPQFPLPDEISQEQTQAINGEVALGDQVRALEKLTEEEGKAKLKSTPVATNTPAPKATPSPVPVPPPPPVPRPQAPPSYPRPAAARSVTPPASKPIASKAIQAAPKLSPTPKVDPVVQWQQAAQLGSFGGVLTQESSAIADSTQNESTPTIDAAIEATVLQERSQRMFLAGSSARAFLQNHLQWEPGQTEVKAVAILSDPMVGADGEVLLPAGTPLVVQLDAASELPQLSIVSATLSINGRAEEIAFPNAAFLVQGTGDRPLVAQRIELKGQASQTDWGRVALGSVVGSAADVVSGNDIDIQGIWRNADRNWSKPSAARNTRVVYFLPAKMPIVVFISQSFPVSFQQSEATPNLLSNEFSLLQDPVFGHSRWEGNP